MAGQTRRSLAGESRTQVVVPRPSGATSVPWFESTSAGMRPSRSIAPLVYVCGWPAERAMGHALRSGLVEGPQRSCPGSRIAARGRRRVCSSRPSRPRALVPRRLRPCCAAVEGQRGQPDGKPPPAPRRFARRTSTRHHGNTPSALPNSKPAPFRSGSMSDPGIRHPPTAPSPQNIEATL